MSMDITIVSKKKTWYTEQLLIASKNTSIKINIVDIKNASDINGLGNVIYWRSASIESSFPNANERSVLFTKILNQKKTIINHALLTNPYLTHKSYQQEFLHSHCSSINTIPTYTADTQKTLDNLLEQKLLSFPFIAKPNHGSQGNGIFLIKSIDDMNNIKEITHYIFQNFIQNNGDYRIYVIGGIAIEIIERKAQKNSFLNNASQGGSVKRVQNNNIRHDLSVLATKIASVLDLSICGIDIIYSIKENKYYFLEVNTVAQWRGLQSVSKINIAEKILDYCQDMHIMKDSVITPSTVEKYYLKNLPYLSQEKQFHFLSRLYLSSHKKSFSHEILSLKENFLWQKSSINAYVTNLYVQKKHFLKIIHNAKDFRLPYLHKFEKIGLYDHILFKTLFNLTVYNNDIRDEVLSHIDQDELIDYYTRLINNSEAISALSTHAVNIICLTQWLLEDLVQPFDPTNFLDIVKNLNLPQQNDTILSRIYILTHAIICASLYYAEPITKLRHIYQEMLLMIEKIILDNYTSINLDQKMEFMTCARILRYNSFLQETILREAEKSCSPHGTFIIDTFNENKMNASFKSFASSEHRNVLFIMAYDNKFKN